MLKHPGGKTHTGFISVANCTGALHVAPPLVDLDAYSTVSPLPPFTPLSKTRYALPDASVTTRWSWLLFTLPAVTLFNVHVAPWSCDAATNTGECVPCRPLNSAHET